MPQQDDSAIPVILRKLRIYWPLVLLEPEFQTRELAPVTCVTALQLRPEKLLPSLARPCYVISATDVHNLRSMS